MAEPTGTGTETVTAEPAAVTKPAAKKPAAKKLTQISINEPTPGYSGATGNRYVMVSAPRTVKEGGQIPVIVSAMQAAGKNGFTATEIATKVAGKFPTVQTPLRVVRYYVSEWRKRKHLKAIS